LASQFPDMIPESRINTRDELRRIAPFRIEFFCRRSTKHLCRRHSSADEVVETDAHGLHHVRQLTEVGLSLDWTTGRYHLALRIRQGEDQILRASSDDHCGTSTSASFRRQPSRSNPPSGRPVQDWILSNRKDVADEENVRLWKEHIDGADRVGLSQMAVLNFVLPKRHLSCGVERVIGKRLFRTRSVGAILPLDVELRAHPELRVL